MRKALLLLTFILGNLSILVVSFLFLTVYTTRSSSALSLPNPVTDLAPSSETVSGAPPTTAEPVTGKIILADARPQIVDQFFRRYRSPMEGLGGDIVASADRYQLPFGLLPAIGQCEGNVGKIMPSDSYNTWGYGIYGSTVKKFTSWQSAIAAISADLRLNYFNRGLDTPAEIMTKYTPQSNGSWANCVESYLAELR